VRGCA